MRKTIRLLLSGDCAEDCPEVICLQLADDLPETELSPVVVAQETMARRPSPHPWEHRLDTWHAGFKDAEWIWSTRKFGKPRVTRSERLVIRRYFQLSPESRKPKLHVKACAVGGLRMYLDGEAVGRPKDGPEGADNFYAEFDRDHDIKLQKTPHLMEFHVKRKVTPLQDKKALPVGGLIYALEITWQEETKADVVKRFVDAWFGAVTSRFFRIVGLLGFLVFLFIALSPRFEAITRTVCGGVAVGFLGAWLSPLIRTEAEREGKKGKQQ